MKDPKKCLSGNQVEVTIIETIEIRESSSSSCDYRNWCLFEWWWFWQLFQKRWLFRLLRSDDKVKNTTDYISKSNLKSRTICMLLTLIWSLLLSSIALLKFAIVVLTRVLVSRTDCLLSHWSIPLPCSRLKILKNFIMPWQASDQRTPKCLLLGNCRLI